MLNLKPCMGLALLISALSGCIDDGESIGGIEADGDVRCVDFSPSPDHSSVRCFQRVEGTEDTWARIQSSCELESIETHTPTDSWWTGDRCAGGLAPRGFGDFDAVACFDVVFEGEIKGTSCYVGDGDRWLGVRHECQTADQVAVTEWPEWQCDGLAGAIEAGPWDSVRCGSDSTGGCSAIFGDDALDVFPGCWLDGFSEGDAPTC